MKMPLLYVTLALVLSACSTPLHTFSDHDKDADIAAYNNYSWLSLSEIESKALNPLYYNELSDKRIKQAVDQQLQGKGFELTPGEQPLKMHYHIIVEDKSMTVSEPTDYSYTNYWKTKGSVVYAYKEGTLIIDLMDATKKTLVWRGWITGAIETDIAKDPEKAIQIAVEKIFKRFPYSRR